MDAPRDFLIFYFLIFYFFSERGCQTFSFSFFPCSADHERDWPPCKVVFFGLATNALNVRNNNNNNNRFFSYDTESFLILAFIALVSNPKIFCNVLRSIFLLNSHISWWCQKSSPWSQGRKTPFGRKERTAYSIVHTKRKPKWYKKNTRKSDISKKRKRKKCGYRGACISKDD